MQLTSGVKNSNANFGIQQYAINPGYGVPGGALGQVPPLPKTLAGGGNAFNPLFGRPTWTYVNIMRGPARGPQPRLAYGTGHTGDPSLPGNAPQLPGYLSDNEYFPTTDSYDTVNQPGFLKRIPKSIMTGSDGREIVGTYKAHDFTPAERFNHHMRQSPYWQVQEYRPDFRNLLAWQQVQKYRIHSVTLSARPLDSSNYFLGYQINPQVASKIGQTTMGYMGSQ